MNHEDPTIEWTDALGIEHRADWLADDTRQPPQRVRTADDRLPANNALQLAKEGTGLLWTGDYHNARHLLQALDRRIEGSRKGSQPNGPRSHIHPLTAAFWAQREQQARRTHILSMVLVHLTPDHQLDLRRAPDVSQACQEAFGQRTKPYALPLKMLLGLIGAHEWRKTGVPIPALQGRRIHAHYGVFSPIRGEYLDLVARAPLPAACQRPEGRAWDIGTGTGVLSAILRHRGASNVVGTDLSERAVACARENIQRLGMDDAITIQQTHMYPPGEADLIVCNPPWLPGQPTSILEHAVYDPGNTMLKDFLHGLRSRLKPNGEGWLILSDLAERLHLRDARWLQNEITLAGLRIIERLDTRPTHRRSQDERDPVHEARSSEVTSLWRLGTRAN